MRGASDEAIEFIGQHVDAESPETWILQESVPPLGNYVAAPPAVIAAARLNDIRGLNRFLIRLNHRLRPGGLLVVRVRALEQEIDDLRAASALRLTFAARYALWFLWKRVMPKVKVSRHLYFQISHGRNRALSVTESLGRLVYCGFKIADTREIDGLLYIVARRDSDPARTVEPSYWPVFKMRRIGQHGRMIGVYKLRTMYAYADTLQGYVYERNSLAEGGKIKGDFRVTEWGRVFRRLWIDELPMLVNWWKGELKFVGVRPLSRHYASLYPADHLEYRQRFKPGLVPPFYADLPRSLDDIIKSEERYLKSYEVQPFLTDCRYFARALYNMLFRGARSQ